MKTVKITKDQLHRAQNHYDFKVLNNSFTNGEGNIYGALGEIIIHDLAKENNLQVDFNSTYDYDLIIDGLKVDVKTKRTTVIPHNDFLCSIAAYNTTQKCDYYFFVRINENMEDAYLCGYKSKVDFFNEAFFASKGSKDINGWIFKEDCYNLMIEQTNQFDKLLQLQTL
jgi:hypothetical protein